jgi:nucleoid-associated protein YgaU
MTVRPLDGKLSSLIASGLLLAVALSGCTKGSQTDTQTTTAVTTQPIAAPSAAAPMSKDAGQPAATAAAQPAASAAQPAASAAADAATQPQTAASGAAATTAVVATSDGSQSGTKFVVNSLTRGSDSVTLKFTLVNGSDKLLDGSKFNGSDYRGYRSMSGIHLIDTVSKKKYFPVADTDGNCVCSNDVADIPAGSQAALWVKFPAPPASVKKITVEVPHFIPLDDVPIAQ